MDLKIRTVPKSPTWYDYKMAVVGTLSNHSMHMREEKGGMVVFYRNGLPPKQFATVKRYTWEHFYVYVLPQILERELSR